MGDHLQALIICKPELFHDHPQALIHPEYLSVRI